MLEIVDGRMTDAGAWVYYKLTLFLSYFCSRLWVLVRTASDKYACVLDLSYLNYMDKAAAIILFDRSLCVQGSYIHSVIILVVEEKNYFVCRTCLLFYLTL